jgi:ribose-phosphate pyrophosphokinase
VYEKSNADLSERIAKSLNLSAFRIDVSKFPNGEFSLREAVVENKHVVVIFPKIKNINEQLIEFVMMLNTCKNCDIIDVVIPYIPYSRQGGSQAFWAIFNLFKPFKIRKIITIDLHTPIDSLYVINILPHEIFGSFFRDQDFIVVAPDNGAKNRAKKFAKYLGTELILIDKNSKKIVNARKIKNRHCLIVDDITDTGRTIENAACILNEFQAKSLTACISHAFSDKTNKSGLIEKIYVTESLKSKGFKIIKIDRAISEKLHS